ncbi:CD36 domain containing protein, partial [Asbolus verrucosus]
SLYCNPKGTMDLTACQNFSLTLSLPHFYLGDSHLNDYVTGLRAEKKLHESFVSIEPRSGISLTFAIRFQINIKLKRFESLTKFAANVSEGIFPILWTEDVIL